MMTETVYSAKTFQGVSKYTERKEFEIGGLVQMRLRQLKGDLSARYYSEIVIADIFSGSGENIVSATDDPIDGSPLRLLWALETSIMTKAGPNPMALARKPVRLLFSDIRPDAISKLNQVVADRWSPVGGVVPQINTAVLSAESAIALLRDHMDNAPSAHLILVLDPNGPKDFPRDGVLDLLAAHGKRIDLIPYISATAINRCLRHREQCGATYDWWLAAIDRFDTGFVNAIANGRGGWVRMPIASDPQRWLMLPTFTPRLLPRNDWAKQGYVSINSPKGQAAIAAYAGIKEAS